LVSTRPATILTPFCSVIGFAFASSLANKLANVPLT
jgi:hypothetical protein